VTSGWRARASWLALTLPLAAMCVLLYMASEWLFIVTRPSALGSMPFGVEVRALAEATAPLTIPLLALQLASSLLSLVAFPRLRPLAVVPSAIAGGALLLLLIDNFTYTLFSFGVLTSEGLVRVLYAAAVPAMVVIAGERIHRVAMSAARFRVAPVLSCALAAGLATASLAIAAADDEPDLAEPPAIDAEGGTARPNILLMGIDGVDADSLSAYGYGRETSPYLSRLRDESLFFENAFSNVGRTHGSLVALLTGRLPFSTHVTFPPTSLLSDDAHRHLPALLKPLGYTSMQLGMRHYADAEDANLLGFDAANYRWQDLDHMSSNSDEDEADVFQRDVAERLDERVGHLFGLRHAIDVYAQIEGTKESPYWKDERRVETLTRYLPTAAEPWFVHTHFLDTHCCSYHPNSLVFSGPDRARDALDSSLREADEHVRQVIESLRASGRLERTIVVITSDHTNGWTTKGRVPLMIRFPGAAIKGRVIDNVQLVDIAPTLMDYLDETIPGWMDGVSLLDEEQRRKARPIFGISEVAGRHGVGHMLTVLDNAGAPNFGAGSITMIAGARWFELSLENGRFTGGTVNGHTAPSLPTVDDRSARAILERRLSDAGFEVHSTDD